MYKRTSRDKKSKNHKRVPNLCAMQGRNAQHRITTLDANRAGHEKQFILTQKIKLKKNNRYLMRTIPPDAILLFSFASDSQRTNS